MHTHLSNCYGVKRIQLIELPTSTASTTTVASELEDQAKIQQELERLRTAMRQMESELAALRTSPLEGDSASRTRADSPITSHTVSVVTVSPGQPETPISSKALDLELVPRAPPAESGPLPSVVLKENSPRDLFFVEGLPKTTGQIRQNCH